MASRCRDCGELRVPAVVACPSCLSIAIDLTELGGTGRVVGRTLVHTEARQPTPWPLVLVDTEEGVRLVGFAASDVDVGLRVRVVDVVDGVPSFAPWEGAS